MKVTRKSQITGITHTLDIPITEDEYNAGMYKRDCLGEHIQDCFPKLAAPLREFLISGITPEEWNEAFPPEDNPHRNTPIPDDFNPNDPKDEDDPDDIDFIGIKNIEIIQKDEWDEPDDTFWDEEFRKRK